MSRVRRLRYSTLWNPLMSRLEAATVLGVEPTASTAEVKRAFRALARQYHPDVNKAPDAEDRFKRIAEAYEVLGGAAGEAAAPPRGRETFEERMERMRQEAMARLRREAAATKRTSLKPEFQPDVSITPVYWPAVIPDWSMPETGLFLGVRKDGNVELWVNNTYKTASPSFPAMIYKAVKLVEIQPAYQGGGDWEGYVTFVGYESPPRLEVWALRELADRVNLPRSGDTVLPPHSPARRSGNMDPSDFS